MGKLSRVLLTGLATALVAASCGGGADSDPTTTAAAGGATTAAPVATTAGGGDDPAPETTTPDTTAAPAGESSATVTIGDQTYEFGPTGFIAERCDTNFFGGFWVLFAGVTIVLPGEDWAAQGIDDPPMVEVKLDELDEEWVANAESPPFGMVAGESQVDSFTIEGNRAFGTATFGETNAAYAAAGGTGDPPVPVTGTFEAVCAG